VIGEAASLPRRSGGARVRADDAARTLSVLIYDTGPDAYVAALSRRNLMAEVHVARDEAQFRALLPATDVLVSKRFPTDALQNAPRLRWIQITSAGIDFLEPVRDRLGHLTITNARGIHGAPIADYVMAVAIMLQSDFRGLMRDQASIRWRRRPVVPLSGRTLGVLGMGAIGQEIARRARSCGMNVLGVRRGGGTLPEATRMFKPGELHAFLAECDIVVVTVPATESTRAMLGRAEFSAMKRTAFIINVARGSVVDEPALIEALRSGVIAGAGLDVFEVEPLPADSPLWTMPNVIVTPHIAGLRADYEEQFMDIFVDNLDRFSRSAPLRNVVDVHRGY